MEMSKDKYKDLMLRFAKELNEVGITDDMIKRSHSSFERTPNLSGYADEQDIRKFHYRHDGYIIEAVRTVKFTVKKSLP